MDQSPVKYFVGLSLYPAPWVERLPPPPPPFALLQGPDLHVTAAFLGPIPDTRARSAFAAAVGYARETLPGIPVYRQHAMIDLGMNAALPFGGPRFEAIGVDFDDDSRAFLEPWLAGLRDLAWSAAGAKRDRLTGHAHVTVARRPGDPCSVDVLDAGRAWAKSLQLAGERSRFASITLFRRDRGGPGRYAVVDSAPM